MNTYYILGAIASVAAFVYAVKTFASHMDAKIEDLRKEILRDAKKKHHVKNFQAQNKTWKNSRNTVNSRLYHRRLQRGRNK